MECWESLPYPLPEGVPGDSFLGGEGGYIKEANVPNRQVRGDFNWPAGEAGSSHPKALFSMSVKGLIILRWQSSSHFTTSYNRYSVQ